MHIIISYYIHVHIIISCICILSSLIIYMYILSSLVYAYYHLLLYTCTYYHLLYMHIIISYYIHVHIIISCICILSSLIIYMYILSSLVYFIIYCICKSLACHLILLVSFQDMFSNCDVLAMFNNVHKYAGTTFNFCVVEVYGYGTDYRSSSHGFTISLLLGRLSSRSIWVRHRLQIIESWVHYLPVTGTLVIT